MNIHHLELFYHVVKNEGITAAARNMPYGIQQAAISGQVAQLEEFLGVVLFHRRPFSLTPPGQKLFSFIKPFFDNLESVAQEVRGGVAQHLRIAASEILLQDYLPDMIQQTRRQFPKLKVTLKEGYYPEVVKWLEQRDVDLCLGLLGGKPPHGIHSLPLFDLSLVLLVPHQSKLQSAAELWEQDHIEEKLITTPSNQVICRAFQQGLRKHKVDWFSGIEVSTVALVETYVVKGYGIGVTVGVPTRKYHPQVRILPLDDFPKTSFGVLWQGFRTPVLDHFLKVVQQAAKTEISANAQTPDSVPEPKPSRPPLPKSTARPQAGGPVRAK
ncbi:MAG TPA: LysR family transcriptional regulator [Candidatus Acidoferrum sp.]|jgi:DNA-binding transcriptional LysR family regulator|nr:LysR family transcriptional regulator [Candidatus Acidoferrum sp.]